MEETGKPEVGNRNHKKWQFNLHKLDQRFSTEVVPPSSGRSENVCVCVCVGGGGDGSMAAERETFGCKWRAFNQSFATTVF